MESPEINSLRLLKDQMNMKISRQPVQKDHQAKETKALRTTLQNNQEIIEMAIKQSFQKKSENENHGLQTHYMTVNQNTKQFINSSQISGEQSIELSSIKQSFEQSKLNTTRDRSLMNTMMSDSKLMPQLKIQFKKDNSPHNISSTIERDKQNDENFSMASFLFQNKNKQSLNQTQQQQKQQQQFAPNKLTKFITSSLQKQVNHKRDSSSKFKQSLQKMVKAKQSNLSQTSRLYNKHGNNNNSPYNTSRIQPSKEQHIPKINKLKSRNPSTNITTNTSRSFVKSSNNSLVRSRIATPDRNMKTEERPERNEASPIINIATKDDQFKQQFMKYLEVLKAKVADMELKTRETQNERNFYKQKYQEQDDQLHALREKEKDFSIQLAQMSQQLSTMKDKYLKNKHLIQSMQSTICSLSISLEKSRKEAEILKYKQQMDTVSLGSQLKQISQQTEEGSISKKDSFSRISSVQKIINDHFTSSPQKQTLDFKIVLKQKLTQLKLDQQIPKRLKFDNDDLDFSKLENQQIEDNVNSDPILQYFNNDQSGQSDEIVKRDKFKYLCRKYGIDSILPVQQFFNTKSNSSTPNDINDENVTNINSDLDNFIRFIVRKLHQEQMNRLKTEEQSAEVIEQLGKTIARLEIKNKQGSASGTSGVGQQSFSKVSSSTPKTFTNKSQKLNDSS